MALDPTLLIVAFAGGVLGAALGGMPSFIIFGLVVIAGTALNATGDGRLLDLAGRFLAPNIAFAGGAAAAAYAARRGRLTSGRDIATPLMGLSAADVLLVGGAFGALGYLLQWLIELVPQIGGRPWTNSIALAFVLSGIVARLVFGREGVFGRMAPGENRWMATDRAAWLTWQSQPAQMILIGIGIGLPFAFVARQFPALAGLGFGIMVASLIFLEYGGKIPVALHVALAAELMAARTGDLGWALSFAFLAAFLGELYADIFLVHADTHIDPPAAALFTTWTLQSILDATGVLSSVSGAPAAGLAILVAGGGYLLITALRRSRKATPPAAQPAVS